MSGAFHIQDGGYTKSAPAPLRAPSPANQAEALRRHLEGDNTPLRSDGDPGWSSFVGHPIADKGISEGLPGNAAIENPRDALKQALASRDKLSAEMRRIGSELKAAQASASTAKE